MDRVSDWYRRWTSWVVIGLAVAIVLVLNVDSLAIAANLWQNPVARQKLSQQALSYVEVAKATAASGNGAAAAAASGDGTAEVAASSGAAANAGKSTDLALATEIKDACPTKVDLQCVSDHFAAADMPLGWHDGEWEQTIWSGGAYSRWHKLLGLLLTIAAISLGAPFWFSVLGRLANLRSSGEPPAVASQGTTVTVKATPAT